MSHLDRWFGIVLCGLAWLWPLDCAVGQDAQLQKRINEGIDNGVRYLRGLQNNGFWQRDHGENGDGGGRAIGATVLAAWTLLECGVPPDDPVIQSAAALIRQAMLSERGTYHLSLGIFFFNKLGDAQDIPFIEALAVRLLRGQTAAGGWTYPCPDAPFEEQSRLAEVVKNRKEGKEAPRMPALPRDPSKLSPEIIKQLRGLYNRPAEALAGDNSNTQFAMLALWVARKYGIPVERAIGLVEIRFRRSETRDGSWGYNPLAQAGGLVMPDAAGGGPSHAMTAAGLIGLGLGHANDKTRAKRVDLLKDPAVQAGFAHLGQIMRGRAGRFNAKHFYFLWTLERMAVGYDVKKIDGIDWYVWGAKQLVGDGSDGSQGTQENDGSWRGQYASGGCDTCFALLFLKRVNVTGVLTDTVAQGIIQDPKTKVKGPKTKPKDLPIDLTPFIPKDDSKKDKTKKTSLLTSPPAWLAVPPKLDPQRAPSALALIAAQDAPAAFVRRSFVRNQRLAAF